MGDLLQARLASLIQEQNILSDNMSIQWSCIDLTTRLSRQLADRMADIRREHVEIDEALQRIIAGGLDYRELTL